MRATYFTLAASSVHDPAFVALVRSNIRIAIPESITAPFDSIPYYAETLAEVLRSPAVLAKRMGVKPRKVWWLCGIIPQHRKAPTERLWWMFTCAVAALAAKIITNRIETKGVA